MMKMKTTRSPTNHNCYNNILDLPFERLSRHDKVITFRILFHCREDAEFISQEQPKEPATRIYKSQSFDNERTMDKRSSSASGMAVNY
jgi:hypothetical protein